MSSTPYLLEEGGQFAPREVPYFNHKDTGALKEKVAENSENSFPKDEFTPSVLYLRSTMFRQSKPQLFRTREWQKKTA